MLNGDFPTNSQIKKNAISFDIDFENIKQNTLTSKTDKKKEPKKVEVIPNVEDPNEQVDEDRYECPNCGRKFKREAYAKHVPICERVFAGKKDIDVHKNEKMNSDPKNKNVGKGFGKKSKWENQSSELRAIIQSKRAEKGK